MVALSADRPSRPLGYGRYRLFRGYDEESTIYERILWAHDRSDLAELALPHVVAIARAFGSEVIVCSVIELDEGIGGTETRRADGVISNEVLDDAAATLMEQGVESVRPLVMQGLAARAIADTAQMEDVQLVVVSTHARGAFARTVLGSVSENVARNTPGIPVLIVQPPEDDEDADRSAE